LRPVQRNATRLPRAMRLPVLNGVPIVGRHSDPI
jgi:hypothetical protein